MILKEEPTFPTSRVLTPDATDLLKGILLYYLQASS
jgi:hypothetical protein